MCLIFINGLFATDAFSIKNYQVTGNWTGPSIAGGVVLGYW